MTLQLVFLHFNRMKGWDEECDFTEVWTDFLGEIQNPNWTYVGVANLRFFSSASGGIELSDGISIRRRDFRALASMGFDDSIKQRMTQDWLSGVGHSEFMLVVKQEVPKEPANLVLATIPAIPTGALRAIGAMRLIGPGDVRIGPIWCARADRFDLIGGLSILGTSVPPLLGQQFVWRPELIDPFRRLFASLKNLETKGYDAAPGNLDVALRSFMSSYDRWPTIATQQLIDTITSLEALLGSRNEVTFRLAFRVASLLAGNGQERAQLFESVTDFYDARSRLVHGDKLEEAQAKRVDKLEELKEIVRRLLSAFVLVVSDPPAGFSKKAFKSGVLERTLLDELERDKLRQLVGLASPS